jgi:hypothetical protein
VANKVSLILAACFCLMSAASQAASASCPYNFVGARGKASIQALETSVVQLFDTRVNSSIGTAYFINDRLLITAGHVIAQYGEPGRLSGENPALNQGRRFKVSVINADEPRDYQDYDVALLEVNDPDFQGPITAIDISFWVPAMAETLWVIGYPGGQVGVNFADGPLIRVLHQGDSLGLRPDEDEKAGHLLYEVKHIISRGYSGGPLLTEEGLAIGTVHKVRDDLMAYYEPLYLDGRVILKLRDLDLPSGLKNVDSMVMNGAPEQNIAAAFLAGRISNVSLTSWYFRLLQSPESPAVASLIRCPIMKLYHDRNLDSLAQGLEVVASPASFPDVYGGSPPPLGEEKKRGGRYGH